MDWYTVILWDSLRFVIGVALNYNNSGLKSVSMHKIMNRIADCRGIDRLISRPDEVHLNMNNCIKYSEFMRFYHSYVSLANGKFWFTFRTCLSMFWNEDLVYSQECLSQFSVAPKNVLCYWRYVTTHSNLIQYTPNIRIWCLCIK